MDDMRVVFNMVVFNSDYVLGAVLESIYPFASQILITEGPVKHFMDLGFTTSTDDTVEIIESFPDPERKITLIRGQWRNKTEMVNAQTSLVKPDTDFSWIVDADEVYKPRDIQSVFGMLSDYDSVGFRSLSFYGGFDHVLTGFEQRAEYRRINRWSGNGWLSHSPPRIVNPETGKIWLEHRHLNFEHLAARGIYLYHYSYVFPNQVKTKTRYYDRRTKGWIISNYYERVYLPWALGDESQKRTIETQFNGVHEFLSHRRGDCYPAPFMGQHPLAMAKRLGGLRERLKRELRDALSNNA